jgi:rSAM/selenodomain-associated transferase 1
MLRDSLDRFAAIEAARVIVYTPANAADYFDRVSQGRYELIPQADGDLGERLGSFFDWAQNRYRQTVVIGTDSPTLPKYYVMAAVRTLESLDFVLGPACDGGFYLIGMNRQLIRPFSGVSWGTSKVLREVVERIGGKKLELMPPWYDIDTIDDWNMLVGHVKALRRVGMDPGVPRLERLIDENPKFV